MGASAEPGSSLTVTSPAAPLVVNPGMTQSVKLDLHSTTIGTTTLRLQLLTKDGSPLTWTQASEPLSVEVTRFGRLILVIIFGALGVLVLATVLRLRRKRRRGGESEPAATTRPATWLIAVRTREVPDEQADTAPRPAAPG